jgi:hypothetical protein
MSWQGMINPKSRERLEELKDDAKHDGIGVMT